jgi:hypothetical protein
MVGHVVHSSSRSFGFFQWLAVQSIRASPAFMPPIIAAIFLIHLGYVDFSNITLQFGLNTKKWTGGKKHS